MNELDMRTVSGLGPFAFFLGLWVSMMAAMMLPGAVPAMWRHIRLGGRLRAAPMFVASYLAVWTVVGLAVYAVYRPPGSVVAGAATIGAGVYELTPLKRRCRRRCRERLRSGVEFGVWCVGSSIGLMVMLVVLGVMSLTWMSAVAVVVLAQKLTPANVVVDVPLGLAIVALGTLIVLAPSSVPAFAPSM